MGAIFMFSVIDAIALIGFAYFTYQDYKEDKAANMHKHDKK